MLEARVVPNSACVLSLLVCRPGVQLGSRGSGVPRAPSSWEARKLFTQEEKVGKQNYVGSTRGQVGEGAKKIGHLEYLLIYSSLSFKETPKIPK